MKYFIPIVMCTVLSALLLASCGQSASNNNGSDTGVARTDNDVMDRIERGIDDVTDGTVFDANGEYSNVDQYKGNGFDTEGNMTSYSGASGAGGTGADMSYNHAGIADSTMNY